jgi:hypothetical protein
MAIERNRYLGLILASKCAQPFGHLMHGFSIQELPTLGVLLKICQEVVKDAALACTSGGVAN